MKVVESIIRSALSPAVLSTFIIGYIMYSMVKVCFFKKLRTPPNGDILIQPTPQRQSSLASSSVSSPSQRKENNQQILTLAQQEEADVVRKGILPVNHNLSPIRFIGQKINRPIHVMITAKEVLYNKNIEPIESAIRTLNILLNEKCDITLVCVASSQDEEEQVITMLKSRKMISRSKIPLFRVLFCEQEESSGIIARQVLPDMYIATSSASFPSLYKHIPKLAHINTSGDVTSDTRDDGAAAGGDVTNNNNSNEKQPNKTPQFHSYKSFAAYFSSIDPKS